MTDINRPAPGFDASTLLAAAEAHEKTRPLPVGTGISSIDNQALGGGFRYGEITSIAGASGSGKTLVCFVPIAAKAQLCAWPIARYSSCGSPCVGIVDSISLAVMKTDSLM